MTPRHAKWLLVPWGVAIVFISAWGLYMDGHFPAATLLIAWAVIVIAVILDL